jgi:hypothetical protein
MVLRLVFTGLSLTLSAEAAEDTVQCVMESVTELLTASIALSEVAGGPETSGKQ